ncbi:MAG: Mur ligase family protein [Myxococcota bacterium]
MIRKELVNLHRKPSREYLHAMHDLLTYAYPLTQARWSLDPMKQLLHRLDPHRGMTILQVGGTNGKGSVCAFLGSMLRQARIPYGVFTSPHLSCMRERIVLNGEAISEHLFCQVYAQVQREARYVKPVVSLFERLLAMALLAFTHQRVQVAILEVGLGGRLDATTAVKPHACAITSISYDHMHLLGKTLTRIAQEKAGIFKQGVPIITSPQSPQISCVLRDKARAVKTQLFEVGKQIRLSKCHDHVQAHWSSKIILPRCRPALFGCHQHTHAAVASALLTTVDLVPQLHVRKRGVQTAVWPGRYEWLRVGQAPVLLDGAHNAGALMQLATCLKRDNRLANRPLVAIVGFSGGHNLADCVKVWQKHMPPILRLFAVSPRTTLQCCLSSHAVAHVLMQHGVSGVQVVGCVTSALVAATNWARRNNACVLVTGSLYLVGQVRALALRTACDSQ